MKWYNIIGLVMAGILILLAIYSFINMLINAPAFLLIPLGVIGYNGLAFWLITKD